LLLNLLGDEIMRGKVTLIRLMLLLVGTTLLVTNCFRKPMAEPFPTPTPLPSGDIFFDSKDLAETRAIEVVIVKYLWWSTAL